MSIVVIVTIVAVTARYLSPLDRVHGNNRAAAAGILTVALLGETCILIRLGRYGLRRMRAEAAPSAPGWPAWGPGVNGPRVLPHVLPRPDREK